MANVNMNALRRLFLLLPLFYLQPINAAEQWNYDQQGSDWPDLCATGRRQSPIELVGRYTLPKFFMRRLRFANYEVPLKLPLTLFNNGHSASLDIPVTENGQRCYISGGLLSGKYDAINVHFHWGSNGTLGSEHAIRGRRFDVEMHIVHRNKRYKTTEEAGRFPDGLAVLGVMFKLTKNPDSLYPGLDRILSKLPEIVTYNSRVDLPNTITLNQLLGDLNRREFFTYNGSLTTPACSEAVSWYVFQNPMPLEPAHIANFWKLQDQAGNPLINNYRALQPINNRLVFYRAGYDFFG